MELARPALICILLVSCRGHGSTVARVPGETGERITVELLNATIQPGLARSGTRALRQAGIDVVYFGNAADTTMLDSTRIVVRRGDSDKAKSVQRALGTGRVVVELDSTRLLDVSVFLGRDFAARRPARPLDFHP